MARIDTALGAHHAPSTLTTYASAWRGFERYCAERGFAPLPVAPEVVCASIASQAERGLTMRMVTSTLAAIDRTSAAGKRDAADILLGFASAMRRCELAALELTDISPAPAGLLLTVRRSKGDPHGAGQTIAIAQGRCADTDPVAALDAWLRVRPRTAGSVFTRVRANGAVSSDPITDASVVRIVKTRTHAVGFTGDRISAHSLRAGHATSAAMTGVPLERIAAQTRHRDLATLVNSYIRPIESMQTTSSRHLGL